MMLDACQKSEVTLNSVHQSQFDAWGMPNCIHLSKNRLFVSQVLPVRKPEVHFLGTYFHFDTLPWRCLPF
jgi:hypothetical protein